MLHPRGSDAERPERHADAERRTIVEIIVTHAPALIVLSTSAFDSGGSGLVRERGGTFSENASLEVRSSRTSSLPRTCV
ncbi:hypothetical protein F4W70_23055 [Pseudomonas cannabina]|nr:hypothetical protein F4W70_23055 [Pseudomonas cannabina]